MKENGKVVEVLTSSISDDGKTMTNREKTDKGETVFVYEKEQIRKGIQKAGAASTGRRFST
jgi:hypothetical protein